MKNLGRRIDLHVHSLLSDGQLLPSEVWRRAEALNYGAIAITDHVDASNLESVTTKIVKAARELEKYNTTTKLYPGVELTHIPPRSIKPLAVKARKLGAELIVVHGETIVEPVLPGTNRAAVECGEADILAHPGLITLEDCEVARRNDVCLELSARQGHCLTNGHVAGIAVKTGVKLVVNTDLHSPEELITQETAYRIAMGAGLDEEHAILAVKKYPNEILHKLTKRT